MKKKRLTGILALASCVALISGCDANALGGLGGKWNAFADGAKGFFDNIAIKLGLKKEEKKDEKKEEEPQPQPQPQPEPQPEPEPEKKMVIGELPEYILVDGTLDLDSYVTLENLESYSVVLGEGLSEVASLEGHVITALAEGEISFTVSAGEFSQACSVDSIFKARAEMLNYFKGVKKDYSAQIYWPDFDDDGNYTGLVADDFISHTSRYVDTTSLLSDGAGGYYEGGFALLEEGDEDAYIYYITEDEEQNEVVNMYGLGVDGLLDDYNSDFTVDFKKAEYEHLVGEGYDVEQFVITGKEAQRFAENSLMIDDGTLTDSSSNKYPITKVEFYLEDVSLTEDPYIVALADLYVTEEDEYSFTLEAMLFTDPEAVGVDCVDEWLDHHPDYYNDLFEGATLSDFFFGPENTSGSLSIEFGWTDASGNAAAAPEDQLDMFDAELPVSEKFAIVCDSSLIYLDDEYAPINGKFAVEVGEGDEKESVVYDFRPSEEGYLVEPDFACESIWDDSKLTFGGLLEESNFSGWTISDVASQHVVVPGDNEEDPPKAEYDVYIASLTQGKFGSLLDVVLNGIDEMAGFQSEIAFYENYGVNLRDYFNGQLMMIPSQGYASLTFMFQWEAGLYYTISLSAMSTTYYESTSAYYEAGLATFIPAE